MVKHINIKQTALLLACLLAVGTVSSQENEAGKRKVNPWGEFNLGINFLDGSKGFTNHMQSYHPALDYRSVYSVAAQVGIGIGVEYCRLTLGMHLDGTADNIISVKNQLVKKQDNLYHVDLGYRFDLGRNFTLEPTAGFGVGLSEIFLSTSRGGTDYVNSFSAANYIVPLTVNFLYGKRRLDGGLYVQYIISVGHMGKAHITGLATEVDDLNFQPSTLTLGWKYRF